MNPTPQERDQTFQNHIMSIVEEGVKKSRMGYTRGIVVQYQYQGAGIL